MRHWKLVLLGLGIAVSVGFINHWMQPQSFAQQPGRKAAKTPPQSTGTDRGWIGLMVESREGSSIHVASVFPAGPSAFATIREGDVVLKVNGVKIQSVDQFAKTVEQLKPNEDAVIGVRREKSELSVKVRVGSLKEFHSHYAREMMRRDPRDPNFAKFHGVSPADMNVEMFRRLFEQNQRLETSLLELRKELSALRSELKQKKTKGR